ncbi:hypothetical protein FOZ63_001618 [Perkinsus olseni]|uniref:Uncharacterized protein n=1 Tax=Perkinsus olseni TaxID=32597 RepID=A0A7J6PSD8_PEROL|nr:hypothetical protein FOZ63_001618 [Perkinsus olseni]
MPNFVRLLTDVAGEAKHVLTDTTTLDKVMQGFADRGYDREPLRRQMEVFTVLTTGSLDPPTPRKACEAYAPSGKLVATHDRNFQSESQGLDCGAAFCPSFLTAKSVSGLARSRIGRGSPLRLPQVQGLTEGYSPEWCEESPALTQPFAGQKVCFAMPATTDRCESLDLENAARTGIFYPFDRCFFCKVCNTTLTWIKPKYQKTVDTSEFPTDIQIGLFEDAFARHATAKVANAANAHADTTRLVPTGNQDVMSYPLCFVDMKLPAFDTDNLTAHDLMVPEGVSSLPEVYQELLAYLQTHCSTLRADRGVNSKDVGVFLHSGMGRLIVHIKQKRCPFPNFLVECTCPDRPNRGDWGDLASILKRIAVRRRDELRPRPTPLAIGTSAATPAESSGGSGVPVVEKAAAKVESFGRSSEVGSAATSDETDDSTDFITASS